MVTSVVRLASRERKMQRLFGGVSRSLARASRSFSRYRSQTREGVVPRALDGSGAGVSNFKNMYDSLVEMYSVSEGSAGGSSISVTRFIDVSRSLVHVMTGVVVIAKLIFHLSSRIS